MSNRKDLPVKSRWLRGLDEVPTTIPEWAWNIKVMTSTIRPYEMIREALNLNIGIFGNIPAIKAWSIMKCRKLRSSSNDKDYKLRRYAAENSKAIETIDFARLYDISQSGACPKFQYTCQLDQHAIRIFTLIPGSETEPIKGTMSTHILANLPAYEALSYTWGKKVDYPIRCDDQQLIIQENLLLALRRLRQEEGTRSLWIDAICINQENFEERAQQVQIMQTVYQRAKGIVVWLGEATKDSHQAFEFLAKMVAVAEKETEDSNSAVRNKPFTAQGLVTHGFHKPSEAVWRALDAIYWREWWTRAWIIQEVAFAKQLEVICGRDRCSWKILTVGAQFILNHSLNAITGVDPQRSKQLSDFNDRIRDSNSGKASENTKLLKLLSEARTSYATDDRDKLYAILGIASDADDPIVRPDYHKSTVEVYTSLAKYFIERDKNLDILSFVEDRRFRLKSELPFWVPDWEVHVTALPFYSNPQFSAMHGAGTTAATCTFLLDGRTLIARGQEIDVIKYAGAVFRDFVPVPGSVKTRTPFMQERFDYPMLHRRRQWVKMATKLKRYPTGEDIMSVYSRTLVAGMPMSNPKQQYETWLRYWEIASLQGGKFISIAQADLSEKQLGQVNEFMNAQYRAAFGRRIFTTKKGYMGLGPSLAFHGCIVVLLHGGRTPFILRKNGSYYEFIGECYIQGLMNGEGLAGPEAQRDFIIK